MPVEANPLWSGISSHHRPHTMVLFGCVYLWRQILSDILWLLLTDITQQAIWSVPNMIIFERISRHPNPGKRRHLPTLIQVNPSIGVHPHQRRDPIGFVLDHSNQYNIDIVNKYIGQLLQIIKFTIIYCIYDAEGNSWRLSVFLDPQTTYLSIVDWDALWVSIAVNVYF